MLVNLKRLFLSFTTPFGQQVFYQAHIDSEANKYRQGCCVKIINREHMYAVDHNHHNKRRKTNAQ